MIPRLWESLEKQSSEVSGTLNELLGNTMIQSAKMNCPAHSSRARKVVPSCRAWAMGERD